jgi:probable HAF family extracellular repeat protein
MDITGEGEFSVVYPADINDWLTVVGTLQMPQDLRFTQAFKWSDNKIEILRTLGGPFGTSSAINNAGDVVGNAQTARGMRHAVLWRAESPIDLGLLARGDYSSARDINDKGDIVGEANTIPNGRLSAFLWHKGRMRQLPKLAGSTFCSAQAVNNLSEIVGSCDLPNGTVHGVIWRGGHVDDLGALGDDDSPSTALDINLHRQVVGSSEVTEGKLRAFLWEKGQLFDLNRTIPPNSGWLLLAASRINDKGEIAGRGYFEGAIRAFILRPEPLPEEKRDHRCLGLTAKSSR